MSQHYKTIDNNVFKCMSNKLNTKKTAKNRYSNSSIRVGELGTTVRTVAHLALPCRHAWNFGLLLLLTLTPAPPPHETMRKSENYRKGQRGCQPNGALSPSFTHTHTHVCLQGCAWVCVLVFALFDNANWWQRLPLVLFTILLLVYELLLPEFTSPAAAAAAAYAAYAFRLGPPSPPTLLIWNYNNNSNN